MCLVVAGASLATAGFREEYLGELGYTSKQIVALAEAMPAEKYSWRPGEGVRSVSEVYVHIAAGNFLLLDIAGVPAPRDLYGEIKASAADRVTALSKVNRRLETTITDKQRLVAMLKQSLDAVRDAFRKAGGADLDKPLKFFGRDSTVRAVYLRILVHINEHMGQSVAYARVNGVVPPWSR
jgi:uncharacterized damage-inducible protein DinB